jgi:hypothetical protein
MAKKRAKSGEKSSEKSGEVPVWEITRLKATPAAYLGRIPAKTAEQAIEEWAKQHDMDEHQKSRLAARRVQ